MRKQLTVLITVALAISLAAPFVGAAAAAGTGVEDGEAQCEYPLEITDATGEEVTIDEEPDSVVTLYPGDAQLAYSIGAEDNVVGMPVGEYTDSLDAGDRTDISEDDGTTPNAEEIVNLDPDVVLAANVAMSDEDLLETLEDAGITVVVLDTAESFEDVEENVRTTGEVTGECDGAEETIEWMNERLDVYEAALEGEDAPLAYYDSYDDGSTFGAETFQHDILTAAGLDNLAAEAGETGWVAMNPESVVAEDPEWIVYPDWSDEPPSETNLQETSAYQEDTVVSVDDNAVSQPAPDIVYVIESLVETVHPDVYEEMEGDLEAVDEEYGVEDGDDESEGDDASDDADDTIPGFGIPAAVAAALVAAAFLTRRQ
ncbi:PGF-CTERM-anchored ABC transporter substrate-binding protein [Natronolimnohabitans innermongolicus]|uniref:Periplasmic binding protein n=1 Tax=Natronolimnohabitans innermongolicus JCM 12255 TaxID=1227499 RepID=L9XKV1_9EURY|nr:PGF-CTERM-anchored ABC transporter substrate-binding protein [Natronolimnohabitans innermongolicus]ELY62202.1 periplasmic binding protein [Natronolimnohabitans innermongolicus JCM 12255]